MMTGRSTQVLLLLLAIATVAVAWARFGPAWAVVGVVAALVLAAALARRAAPDVAEVDVDANPGDAGAAVADTEAPAAAGVVADAAPGGGVTGGTPTDDVPAGRPVTTGPSVTAAADSAPGDGAPTGDAPDEQAPAAVVDDMFVFRGVEVAGRPEHWDEPAWVAVAGIDVAVGRGGQHTYAIVLHEAVLRMFHEEDLWDDRAASGAEGAFGALLRARGTVVDVARDTRAVVHVEVLDGVTPRELHAAAVTAVLEMLQTAPASAVRS